MVLGKRWLFSIGNGAKIRPPEMGRKSPAKEQTVNLLHSENTVNSEIFVRTLFSRNFAS